MTKILFCTCEHKFQDSRYGKNLRVHNFRTKTKMWSCTVCTKEKK